MDANGLIFGWRSALLGVFALQCLGLSLALFIAGGNRIAQRLLAAALLVVAGWLTPYALGFAGAFDAFRGLTFLPVAAPLGLGPLLYLYIAALIAGGPPRRLRLHLALPVIQWAYFAVCFLLPPPLKWDWYTSGHREVVGPLFSGLLVVSLIGYSVASAMALRDFHARLKQERSDDERFAAGWLGRVLIVLIVGVGLQTGFWLWSVLSGGINYFQETGLYLGLGLIGVYLGVEGWRYSALPPPLAPITAAVEERPAIDWRAAAVVLEGRVRDEGWWREPELSLAQVARRLGMNTGRVSRIINLGLGQNFSGLINGLRAEAVAAALRSGHEGDLLSLALEMGFSSKASFNRAFLARYGMPPSRYRREVSDPDSLPAEPDLRRLEPAADAG